MQAPSEVHERWLAVSDWALKVAGAVRGLSRTILTASDHVPAAEAESTPTKPPARTARPTMVTKMARSG